MSSSLELDVEIKSPADNFFKSLSKEIHNLPKASDSVHGFEVHDSVKSWSYTIDGKKSTFKEKFNVDEANMTVCFEGMGGDLLEQYKSFKVFIKVAPNDGKPGEVKIKVVYEKFNETDPNPNNYVPLMVSVMKDLDAHLISVK